MRFPESFVGPQAAILRPKESEQLDYEGEIVLVIGKAGRRIPRAAWRDHVFGLSIANEGTLRDWVRHGQIQRYARQELGGERFAGAPGSCRFKPLRKAR